MCMCWWHCRRDSAEKESPTTPHGEREKELVWSQWDDLFLSGKEQKRRSARPNKEMTSGGTHAVLMDTRKRVELISADCTSLLFKTNTRGILVARIYRLNSTAQLWYHLSSYFLSLPAWIRPKIPQKQTVLGWYVFFFLGVGSWVHFCACQGYIQFAGVA